MPNSEDMLFYEWAKKIKLLGLSTAVAFFLEAYKPLSFVTGQFIIVGQPILNLFLSPHFTSNTIRLLSDKADLDIFIRLLEQD